MRLELKITFLCLCSTVAGFHSAQRQRCMVLGICTNHLKKGNTFGFRLYNNISGNSSDVEAVREKLELSIGASYDLESNASPPPMTITQKERREHEINLIKSLEESDEASQYLWEHWFNERGASPAKKLEETNILMNAGPGFWDKTEEKLLEIINEQGYYWVEPLNRLATLKYLQGKHEESKDLCLKVLDIKPWHFGALSGIVLVFVALNDSNNAKIWANRRLPPLQLTGENEHRREWVVRAVKDAHNALSHDESRGTESDFEEKSSLDDDLYGSDNTWQ